MIDLTAHERALADIAAVTKYLDANRERTRFRALAMGLPPEVRRVAPGHIGSVGARWRSPWPATWAHRETDPGAT